MSSTVFDVQQGIKGLQDKSRMPHTTPCQTDKLSVSESFGWARQMSLGNHLTFRLRELGLFTVAPVITA